MFVSYDIQPVHLSPDGCCALDELPKPGSEMTVDFWGLYGRDKAGFASIVGDYQEFSDACEVYTAITGNAVEQTEPAVLMGLSASKAADALADALRALIGTHDARSMFSELHDARTALTAYDKQIAAGGVASNES